MNESAPNFPADGNGNAYSDMHNAPEADPKSTITRPAPLSFRMVGDLAPLFAAKAQARLAFKPIAKNRTVKVQPPNSAAYTFDYATLDSVRDSCDEALASNGLDIFHAPVDAEDARELHTFLTHSSGAFLECVIVIPANKQTKDGPRTLTIQEVGSALTYWERYSYVALAGVASEHDDDGNAADGNKVEAMTPRDRTRPAPPPSTTKPAARQPQTPAPAAAAPPPASEPPPAAEAAPEPKAAPAGAQEPPTTEQKKAMSELFRFPRFGFNGSNSKALIERLTGRGYAELGRDDYQLVVDFMAAAKRLDTYDAAGLLAFVEEQGDGGQAMRAIAAEADAFLGGS